jgi:hypothetical protein
MTQADHGIDFSNLTDQQIMKQLALRWKQRREGQEIKVKTVKHADHQLTFFLGAFQAMELCGRKPPQSALLLLSVGRDAVELWGNLDV